MYYILYFDKQGENLVYTIQFDTIKFHIEFFFEKVFVIFVIEYQNFIKIGEHFSYYITNT